MNSANAEKAYNAFRMRAGGKGWSELPEADKTDWEAVVSALQCPEPVNVAVVSETDARNERQVGALDVECEKYLAEQNLYSVADHLDETDPVDIFTTDGEPVLIQIPKDISVYYLMMLVEHGRQQYAKGSSDHHAKSTTPELQDPIAVINTMQFRIGQLERQLQAERAAAQGNYEQVINDAVRRLRLHCVIPLYVGTEDFDKVRSDVRKSSPLLISALEETWLLQSAPVPETAKSALLAAANHGMNRWQTMPANILNLPDYKVVRVEETDHDYHITAEVSNPPKTCSVCGSTRMAGHGRNEQVIRDLPSHGKRVAIYIDNRRWRCQDCGKTAMEILPAVNSKREMTERLVQWIGKCSLKRTFASLAEEAGLDEKTIRNIFRDYVNELEATVRFETPKWMGIDEIHLIKPRGVITNIENNTVVELLANRNQDTIAKYLTSLKGKDKVQYVAMDMWKPYKTAVNAVLPQATVVIDKFHIVKMANEALEKVRKSMRADLTLKQKRGLMHDRFVLLKRERDLTDKERFNLDGWVQNYPLLGEAYRLKEAFYGVYDTKSQSDAVQAYEQWQKSIPPELHDHFHELTRAFQNWMPDILAYFSHPVTNAYTESLNSLIRVMDRMGRGYSFEALRAKILFTEGAHFKKKQRPKFARKNAELGYGLPTERVMYDQLFTMSRMAFDTPNQHEAQETEINFGADISTLVRLIEDGKL